MIEIRASRRTAVDWNALIAGYPEASLLQTFEWGEAKTRSSRWRVDRLEFVDQERVIGAAQVLIWRPLFFGGLAWLNRGPLLDVADSDRAPELFRLLHQHYVREQSLYLRIAPTLGDEQLERVLQANPQFNRAEAAGHRAGRIDLEKSEEQLRAGLKQSWRRFLVKAERFGTPVEISQDNVRLQRFLGTYREILKRASYKKSVDLQVYAELQRQLPPDKRLILFEAVVDSELASWVLIATYGHTGEYLAAASLPAGRRRNCGQLLTWRAMLHLKSLGFKVLDMGGFDPEDDSSGVSHFKRGTGATPYHLCSEIDAFPRFLPPTLVRALVSFNRSPTRLWGLR